MKYIIADKAKAVSCGFSVKTHRTNGNLIILNEKEIVSNPGLSQAGSLEEKSSLIEGTVYTYREIINVIEQGGWNNE